MATLYNYGRNEFALGNIDWVTDDVGVALLSSTYTFSQSHQDMADVTGIVAQTPTPPAVNDTIANKSTPDTDGACDGDDYVLGSVSGSQITQMVLYLNTGTPANDTLIAFYDSGDVTGLPLTPNGGDVTIAWQASTPYIFKL
jgi:hypothetical protein